MPVEVKKFSGILDKDTPDAEVNYNYHIDAKNVVFRGDGVGKRVQNIVGNTKKANNLLPTEGLNECIGAYYDNIRKRIFTFNHNTENKHGIYYYSIDTQTWTRVLENFINTDEDILNFDLNHLIHSVNVLYGGEGQSNADILYFVDSLKRPTQINVNTYVAGIYNIVKRSYIDVLKAPPKNIPQVTYENDTTVTINNLKNALYQFRTRFKYDNNEKSVYSAASKVALPYNTTTTLAQSDITKNARIAIYVETGDETVKNIEIIGKKTTDNSVEGWFLITSLNKQELNIPNNSYYKFLFYNDGAYTLVDQEETTQLFDYVPDEANTQELLNGNVPIYGGIKEGRDYFEPNITVDVSDILFTYENYNGVLFFGYQKDKNTIGLYLTGCGTNNVQGEPTTIDNCNAKFEVSAKTTAGTDVGFSSFINNTSISAIITELVTQAASKGWNVVTTATNYVELTHPNDVFLGSAFPHNVRDGVIRTSQNTNFSLSEASGYSWGIQYFDEKGKTNGVIYSQNLSINTLSPYVINPLITLSIYHRPPLWASYYHIVRTDTLTYQNKLYWVSTSAYSDDTNIGGIANTRYAYVNIDNITSYNKDLNTDSNSVSYEFAKGDRIRFLGVYNIPSSPNTLLSYTTAKEYEILGVQTNPFINGIKRTGTFVKILYPTNDISSNFKFDGSYLYSNYYILLYTPKKTINKDNLPFFEVGKKFDIGNAGTENAIHLGQEQIQSNDLSIPAIIKTGEGDLFFRNRTVPKNSTKEAIPQSYSILGDFRPTPYGNVVPINFEESVPITTSVGTINNTPSTNLNIYPVYSDAALFYNTSANTVKIRVRFTGTVKNDSAEGDYVRFSSLVTTPSNVRKFTSIKLISALPNADKPTEFSIDTYVDVPANNKFWLASFCNGLFGYSVTYTDFKLDVIDLSTIYLIEKTYNDYYPIQTNSDGRASVIDKDAKRQYNPTLVRWGLAYQQNTNINQTNRFKAVNFDECDRSKGDILRFKARQRILRVFQDRGVGQYGVYARYIQNNSGGSELVTTNDIITANNIQYYAGEYGLGGYPTSLVSGATQDYFVDPVRGYQVRLSGDGMTAISEIYKGQYYLRNLLTKYNNTYFKPNTAKAQILGYYDYFEEQYVCILQGGIKEGGGSVDNYTFAFNEKNNGYSSFYEFYPEMCLSAEDIVYTWKSGEMWVHNNTTNYCNFYDEQYNASITTVFNQNLLEKKTFVSLTELANTIWKCPLIYSNMNTYGTQRQETNLVNANFATYESQYHAPILRDVRSAGGKINGAQMKGGLLVIKFEIENANKFVFLSEVSLKYIISPLTNR